VANNFGLRVFHAGGCPTSIRGKRLTPAESNVALLLCAGLVPKDIARRLDVSLPTVRSYLRALLDKTGTARQSELLSLLSSLPSTTATFSP